MVSTAVPPSGTVPEPGTNFGSAEPDEVEVLDVSEAARRAGLSERGIRRALAEGRLEGSRDEAGRWWTTAVALERFVEERPARNEFRNERPAGTSSGTVPEPRPELTELIALLRDLTLRHEAACIRLGAVEAEAERLRARVVELEAGTVEEAPEVTEMPVRRRWWTPWRRPSEPSPASS